MELLQIVCGRLPDISFSCLCLSAKVIIIFKSSKIYFYIFIVKIVTKFSNKITRPSIKKELSM